MHQTKKIMIIAGEASGDLHGAKLVNDLKAYLPGLEITGMGGTSLKQAGVDLIADISDFSVCGFFEIIAYLPKIIGLYTRIKKAITNNPPDLLILIDYPSFNLRLANLASKLNIKVLYYISPQIWAWHTSRVKKIKRTVNMMAVIFPFESDFYQQYNVPVKYVGHPLSGGVVASRDKDTIKRAYHLSDEKIVGILPGSRKNEIRYILPTLLKTAELLQQKDPSIRFILPLADTLTVEDLASHLTTSSIKLTIIQNQRYDAMSICDAVIAASGTVTLELAMLGIPQVVVYKGNSLSFRLAKHLVKIPHIALCNIVAGRKIAKELLQDDANPEKISQEILKLLEDSNYRNKQQEEFAIVSKKLATQRECSLTDVVRELVA